jgi:hypothetical protein
MQPLLEKVAYNKPVITQQEIAVIFPKSVETLLSLSQAMLGPFFIFRI